MNGAALIGLVVLGLTAWCYAIGAIAIAGFTAVTLGLN